MARRLPLLLLAGLLVGTLSCSRPPVDDDFGPVGTFTLTERSGQQVSADDLKGKVWIASFIFTRCTTGCPQVTATMARLQKELNLADREPLRLVTFTVDPERDSPDELKQYANLYQAHPERWLFLTGKQEEIHELLLKGFKVSVAERPEEQKKPGDEFDHSTRLVLVDREGKIRGYFSGMIDPAGGVDEKEFETSLRKLRHRTAALLREGALKDIDFPLLNASLNMLGGILLVLGYLAVRQRAITAHKVLMLAALGVSTVFLSSYLYYHIIVRKGESTKFAEQAPEAPAWVATTYYAILGSHIVLAAVVVPMALILAYLGLRNRIERHVKLARWTLPIWLYVSITGVVVYWMLYRLYPLP